MKEALTSCFYQCQPTINVKKPLENFVIATLVLLAAKLIFLLNFEIFLEVQCSLDNGRVLI